MTYRDVCKGMRQGRPGTYTSEQVFEGSMVRLIVLCIDFMCQSPLPPQAHEHHQIDAAGERLRAKS